MTLLDAHERSPLGFTLSAKSHFKLTLSYQGSAYFGWQKNREQPTIEKALEEALLKLQWGFIRLEGASRTDAGVHAKGQVVRIDLSIDLLTLLGYAQTDSHTIEEGYQRQDLKESLTQESNLKSSQSLQRTLGNALLRINSQLPPDIRVVDFNPCRATFHPTLDAVSKTYIYRIRSGLTYNPLERHLSWHLPHKIDRLAIAEAAELLIGTHDFKAFANQGRLDSYDDYRRCLYELRLLPFDPAEPDEIKILVRGNHFLYKMVRNLVGTLVMVGRGKLKKEDLTRILESKERRLAPLTAPSHGLLLAQIDYL